MRKGLNIGLISLYNRLSCLHIMAFNQMIQLTLIRQVILYLVLLHLSTPALHALCLSLQQLQEPAAITRAHRPTNGLQSRHLWLRHAVHPGVRRGQDGRVKPHLSVIVCSTSVVMVPGALDAHSGSGSVTRVLARHGGTVPWRQFRGVGRVVKVSLYSCGYTVGAGHPAVTRRRCQNKGLVIF